MKVNGSIWYSKIDLKSAFNLIRIEPGKEYLTAFRTKYGHFEYLVIPFGMKNAPGTFQTLMNSIFGDLIDRGILVYIDDILIYASSREEHDKLLIEVFKRLEDNRLLVKMEKCEFLQNKVTFLGHVLSKQGIQMDPSKLKSILEWEFPLNVKQLQSFLGLANYYRSFIPMFSAIAASLFDLTRKDKEWLVGEKERTSFTKLKALFASHVILEYPDPNKQFYLEVDASDFAVGVY